MNILINFLYKEASGPVFSLEMARGLALNGCNIYAVLSSKISNRSDWENEKLIKDICFIDTGTRDTAIKTTFNFLTHKKTDIKKYFQTIEFDYIIQTFYHPWMEFVNRQINYNKIVTLCHDPILHSGVKKREIWATKRFINKSDEIVVLTKSYIPLVEKNYKFTKNHIHFMPHGRMGDYKKNQTAIQENSYNNKNVNFLFFGRVGIYKGLNVLAEAFLKLEEKYTNVYLTVAGSGEFSEFSENYAKIKNLNLQNRYIKDEEVGNFFDNPTVVLVLPYLDATQSGVTPIALEYGVPVIASDSGGLKEQLDNGNLGLFVEAGNSRDLYKKMEDFVVNPNLAKEQKIKMVDYLENLNWDKVTKMLLDSLKKNR